jgi:hypothetical protein
LICPSFDFTLTPFGDEEAIAIDKRGLLFGCLSGPCWLT